MNAQISAADAVVLAIPMSPVTRHRLPAATRSRATSSPATSAATACSRLIAGPSVKSAVPRATLRGSSPGGRLEIGRDPHVDHETSAPTWAANALTTAPPARKLATICAVTSCGHGRDPLRVHAVVGGEHRDAAGSGSGGGHSPGQARQPHRHLLKDAERAARLGHPVLAFPGGGHRLGVGRGDGRDQVGERVHWCLPWHSAAAELLGVHRPATPAGGAPSRPPASSGSAPNAVT